MAAPYAGNGKLIYRWTKDGVAINGATKSAYSKSEATWTNSGIYTLEVTDQADGARAQSTFYVRVAMPKGHLVVIGDNDQGQSEMPASLLPPRRIHAIAAGRAHNLAIATGVVVAWGDNAAGQCTVPTWGELKAYGVAAGAAHSLALLSDGSVRAWGDNSSGQCSVPDGLGPVRAITAGTAHSLALLQDGTVVGWGENAAGQLNPPSFTSPVIALAAGHDHSLALLQNGTVVAWGANDRGQITIPSGLRNLSSIGAAGDASFAVDRSGRIYAWGDTSFRQVPPPAKLKPVSYAAGGWDFIAARLGTGGLAFWGSNVESMTTETKGLAKVYALAAGSAHVLALRDGASDAKPRIVTQPSPPTTTTWDEPVVLSVGATGAQLSYQWYLNGVPIPEATEATYRIDAMRLEDVGAYMVRVFNGASLVDSSRVSVSSPLLPSLVVRRATSGRQVVRPGDTFRIEIGGTGAGDLNYVWRHNGVLIPGANSAVLERVVTSVDDSGIYIAEVTDDARRTARPATMVVVPPALPVQIVAWGDNSLGQSEVPDGINDAIALATGDAHTLALRVDGTVVSWGDNRAGQTTVPAGLKEVTAISAWGTYSAALCADGTIVAWGGGRPPQTLATASDEYTRISVGPNGVNAIKGAYLDYVTGMTLGTTFTYSLAANGSLDGFKDSFSPPLFPFATTPLRSVMSKSVASQTISMSSTIGTIIDAPPGVQITGSSWSGRLDTWNYNDGPVYWGYSRNLRAFSHYNGISVALGTDKVAHFWAIDQQDYYNGVCRSYPIVAPTTFDQVSAATAGANAITFAREDGGVGGFGVNQRAFARAPFRISGVRALRAGANHVVALIEADAPPVPHVIQAPENRAAAPGEAVRLTVRAEGRHLRYQWFHEDMPIPAANDPALDLGAFETSKAGRYFVRISDGFSAVSTSPITLSEGMAPVLTQSPTRRLGLRVGERLELAASLESMEGISCQWLRDGVALVSETRPTLVREAAALTDAGRYTLQVTGRDGASVRVTSHVFVLPVAGSSIIHQNDVLYPLGQRGKWRDIDDAVDFLPTGLALRLDGQVYAWDVDYVRNPETKAWLSGLSDIVAISETVLLHADGRLAISPATSLSPEAAALTDVIALIPGARTAVVTQDGRVGVLGRTQDPIQWLPSVGDYVAAQNIWVGFMENKKVNSYGPDDIELVVLGADGTTVTQKQSGRLGFSDISSGRRVLPDADGGVSIVDAAGTIHAASSYGRLRVPDDALTNVRQAEMDYSGRVELRDNGSVRAWKIPSWNADLTEEVPTLAVWKHDNLRVRISSGQVMVLRSNENLPSVAFARPREVFEQDAPIILEPTTAGVAPLTFTWERNGAVLADVIGPRLELPAGDPRNAGWYRLRVTNADGVTHDDVVYVQIHTPGARLISLPDSSWRKAPKLTDIVDMAPGIAIRADGTVALWDETTGEARGIVPEGLGEVVAVTRAGAALNASGILTTWNPVTGEVTSRLEGVLWLRDEFAIMRNGTVCSFSGSRIHGVEAWHREVVDLRRGLVSSIRYLTRRDGSVAYYNGISTMRYLTRRDGSVAYYNEESWPLLAYLVTRDELGGTVFDIRVPLTGGEFLVEQSGRQASLTKLSLVATSTSLRVFDRNGTSDYAITASSDLVSKTETVIYPGVLRLWSPWALVKPETVTP